MSGSAGNAGEYVVRSDKPVKPGDTPPLFITAKGHELKNGLYTPLLPIARRWRVRSTVWRWLKHRQRPDLAEPTLGPSWYVHNLAPPRPRPRRPRPAPH